MKMQEGKIVKIEESEYLRATNQKTTECTREVTKKIKGHSEDSWL